MRIFSTFQSNGGELWQTQLFVINICDGARLGCICDLEIDDSTGTICSIVVPGPSRFLGLLRNSEELVIPFCKIKKIGDDVILVDIVNARRQC